jgi:guanylate kinase
VVLKIDVEGALEVMEQRPDARTVFILPPSREELERRIRDRGGGSEETIQRRLKKADWEIGMSVRYQFRIVNDVLDRAARELQEAVTM